jgi:hypothetical protein
VRVRHCRAFPQRQNFRRILLQKRSLALLLLCSLPNALLGGERASIGNILHLAVDCRVYPNASMVVTALGFRSKGCRFS